MPDEKYLSPENWIVPVTRNNYTQYREWLKRELLFKRHYRSDWSGECLTISSGCELHEGIVPRRVVPLSVSWHVLIYHEINSFLLLPAEHRPQPPSRSWCVGKAYELYGRDAVRNWFYNELKWKSKPPFQLP